MADHYPTLSIRRTTWDAWAVTEDPETGDTSPATKRELLGRHLQVIDDAWPDPVLGENTVLVSLGLIEWRLPRWADRLPPGTEGTDWRVVSSGYHRERHGQGPRGARNVPDEADRQALQMSALTRAVYRYRDQRKNLAFDIVEELFPSERRRPKNEEEGIASAAEAKDRYLAAVEAAGEDGTPTIERRRLPMKDVQLDGTDVWDDEEPRPGHRWAGELD